MVYGGGWLTDWIEGILSWIVGVVFASTPRIAKENGRLIASSGWKTHLLTLGFGSRRLVVDPDRRTIVLMVRRFWAFSKRIAVPFDEVREVLYTYHDASLGVFVYREQDLFVVGLLLRDGRTLTLFRFYGNGGFVNDTIWHDWMYWPQEAFANATVGTQESASLAFADVLSRLTGAPIGNGDTAV